MFQPRLTLLTCHPWYEIGIEKLDLKKITWQKKLKLNEKTLKKKYWVNPSSLD